MIALHEYLQKAFYIDSNTSATLLITLFVFIAGMLLRLIVIVISNYIKRRRIRKTFNINLRELIKEINEQSIAFENTIETLSIENSEPFRYKRKTISTLSSINNLGYYKIYDAYFHGLENLVKLKMNVKREIFTSMWNSIKSVEYWHNFSFQDKNRLIDKYNSYREKWSDATVKINDEIKCMRANSQSEQTPSDFEQLKPKVFKAYSKWITTPNNFNPTVINDKLVDNLIEIIEKHTDPSAAAILYKELVDASLQFQNQKNLIETEKEQIKLIIKEFTKNQGVCEKALDELN